MSRPIRAEFGSLFTTRLWMLRLGSVALNVPHARCALAFGDDPGNPTPSR